MKETLYTAAEAAKFLADKLLHKDEKQWYSWLQNNRSPNRWATYRIPFEPVGRGVMYSRANLVAFIEWEKARLANTASKSSRTEEALRAIGLNEPGGSTTGRKFEYDLTPALDEITGEYFASLHIRQPHLIFRLSPYQLASLAADATEISKAFSRWSK